MRLVAPVRYLYVCIPQAGRYCRAVSHITYLTVAAAVLLLCALLKSPLYAALLCDDFVLWLQSTFCFCIRTGATCSLSHYESHKFISIVRLEVLDVYRTCLL